jgi:hypothetical protein
MQKSRIGRLRVPLALTAVVAVLFDIYEAFRIRSIGFPPNDLARYDETGAILLPTAQEHVAYSAILIVIALLQVGLFWLTWKAWREPKQDDV